MQRNFPAQLSSLSCPSPSLHPSNASGHLTIQRLQLIVNPFAWTSSLRQLVIGLAHSPTFSYVIRHVWPCPPGCVCRTLLFAFVEDNSTWNFFRFITPKNALAPPISLWSCCIARCTHHSCGCHPYLCPLCFILSFANPD